MPTRKQRRRQQKNRRHEYEEVYVDAEGNVIELEDAELPAETAATRNGRKTAATGRPQRAARPSLRAVQPPSLRRVLKRGAIFAPVMFILVSLLSPDFSIVQRVTNTLFLVLIFLPFSYLMDSLTYRIWLRRSGQAAPGSGPRSK
jgi:hypothetical protein